MSSKSHRAGRARRFRRPQAALELLALRSLYEINRSETHANGLPGDDAGCRLPAGDSRPLQASSPPVVNQPQAISPPPGIKYLKKIEDLIFDQTNQLRRAQGLAPLSQDDELTNVARAYSNDMLVRRFFDHTNPDGLAFHERIVSKYPHRVRFTGENIWSAFGYNPSNTQKLAKEIVDDWIEQPRSPGQCARPRFYSFGGGGGLSPGTARFGRRKNLWGGLKASAFGNSSRRPIKALWRGTARQGNDPILMVGSAHPHTAALSIFFYRKPKTENRS